MLYTTVKKSMNSSSLTLICLHNTGFILTKNTFTLYLQYIMNIEHTTMMIGHEFLTSLPMTTTTKTVTFLLLL